MITPTPGSANMKPWLDGVCLSTDVKPTNVANGSVLVEMDTATVYFFDAEGRTWRAFRR